MTKQDICRISDIIMVGQVDDLEFIIDMLEELYSNDPCSLYTILLDQANNRKNYLKWEATSARMWGSRHMFAGYTPFNWPGKQVTVSNKNGNIITHQVPSPT